jgi:hypothetical protein
MVLSTRLSGANKRGANASSDAASLDRPPMASAANGTLSLAALEGPEP